MLAEFCGCSLRQWRAAGGPDGGRRQNRSAAISLLGTATLPHADPRRPDPTPTDTPTPTPTFTPTPTATATRTATPSAPAVSSGMPSLTPRLADSLPSATSAATATPAGPATATLIPSPTPTPVPRTVLASSLNLPDPTQAQDHFWFTRPFTDAFATWGSSFILRDQQPGSVLVAPRQRHPESHGDAHRAVGDGGVPRRRITGPLRPF
jgi:hypothetical protein